MKYVIMTIAFVVGLGMMLNDGNNADITVTGVALTFGSAALFALEYERDREEMKK